MDFLTGLTNLTNWFANVIMPTLAGVFFVISVLRFSRQAPFQYSLFASFAALMEVDEEGRCFLVETVAGESGQSYTKMTFLMAVTPDGKVVYDGGRVRWVHPFPYEAGAGEVRNGKLELPGTRQLPQVVQPSKPI